MCKVGGLCLRPVNTASLIPAHFDAKTLLSHSETPLTPPPQRSSVNVFIKKKYIIITHGVVKEKYQEKYVHVWRDGKKRLGQIGTNYFSALHNRAKRCPF